jgi:hypothetical protein
MEFGKHHLNGRYLLGLVNADGDTAAVVFDTDAAVTVNDHTDQITIAGHGFVDAVVNHFVDQMVQACHIYVSDIHGGSETDRFQSL